MMSFKILFILSALVKIFGSLLAILLSLSPIKAPVVEGSDTKSKQINWKSSWTNVEPPSDSVTDPSPLDEIPSLTFDSTRERRICPDGVFKTSGDNDPSGNYGASTNILYLGQISSGSYSDEYIDSYRISKGVARYPSGTTFTPPTEAFVSDYFSNS